MPIDEGMSPIKEFLSEHPYYLDDTDTILRLSELALKLNNSVFHDTHYLQIQGVAMGSRMSPSFSNILVGNF